MTPNYTISYDPLWKTLIDKKLTKTELAKRIVLSKATMAKMGKNEMVTLDVIGRTCAELQISISALDRSSCEWYSKSMKLDIANIKRGL